MGREERIFPSSLLCFSAWAFTDIVLFQGGVHYITDKSSGIFFIRAQYECFLLYFVSTSHPRSSRASLLSPLYCIVILFHSYFSFIFSFCPNLTVLLCFPINRYIWVSCQNVKGKITYLLLFIFWNWNGCFLKTVPQISWKNYINKIPKYVYLVKNINSIRKG